MLSPSVFLTVSVKASKFFAIDSSVEPSGYFNPLTISALVAPLAPNIAKDVAVCTEIGEMMTFPLLPSIVFYNIELLSQYEQACAAL